MASPLKLARGEARRWKRLAVDQCCCWHIAMLIVTSWGSICPHFSYLPSFSHSIKLFPSTVDDVVTVYEVVDGETIDFVVILEIIFA